MPYAPHYQIVGRVLAAGGASYSLRMAMPPEYGWDHVEAERLRLEDERIRREAEQVRNARRIALDRAHRAQDVPHRVR